MLNWIRICELYIHGWRCLFKERYVEVIRHYASEWHVYKFRYGVQLTREDADRNTYSNLSSAKSSALKWLKTEDICESTSSTRTITGMKGESER